MFSTARKAARAKIIEHESGGNGPFSLPSHALPEKYSIRQLHEDLSVSNEWSNHKLSKRGELENIIIIHSCLEHGDRILRDDNTDYISKLSFWLSRAILPDGSIDAHDDTPQDEKRAGKDGEALLARCKATLGIQALHILLDLEPQASAENNQQLLIALLAFTDTRDWWTSASSFQEAHDLLQKFKQETASSGFIVESVLKSFIQPLFSKSKPSTITASGRKAMVTSAPQQKFNNADFDPSNKPWKYKEVYAVSVFRWAVDNVDHDLISQSWPLIIPPLLTLLDDTTTSIRANGLLTLSSFLPKLSAKLLAQTGLGQVFEDAVMPTLLYLPNLTPIDESLKLLALAYAALYMLSDIRFPITEENNVQDERIKFLDRVMRHGVLTGYSHSSEYPQIVELLVCEIQSLIGKMGIYAVKHLKDIIPILATVLTNPFGASHPCLLQAAVEALRGLILNCWPRLTHDAHRIEIINALVRCWNLVREHDVARSEEDRKILQRVMECLKVTGQLLVKSVENEMDIMAELEPLLLADPTLLEVFGTPD